MSMQYITNTRKLTKRILDSQTRLIKRVTVLLYVMICPATKDNKGIYIHVNFANALSYILDFWLMYAILRGQIRRDTQEKFVFTVKISV
jgi:hypothetical protein